MRNTRNRRKVRNNSFLYDSDLSNVTENSEQNSTHNMSVKEALNQSKVKQLFKNACQCHNADVKLNYTSGNITIRNDTNLLQAWIDSLNKVFADSVLEWKIRDSSTGKPYQHRAEIPYNGKLVAVNIYTTTGTILIQGAGYLEWLSRYCEQILKAVHNWSASTTTSNTKTAILLPHSTPCMKKDNGCLLDCTIEDLVKLLGSPIQHIDQQQSCVEMFDELSPHRHPTHTRITTADVWSTFELGDLWETPECEEIDENANLKDKVLSGMNTIVHLEDLVGLTQDPDFELRCLQREFFEKNK